MPALISHLARHENGWSFECQALVWVFETEPACIHEVSSPHSLHLFLTTTSQSYHSLHFEESPEPPDLEDRLPNDNSDDEDVPPLHSAVGALCGIPVGALADYDVRLLILDLGEDLGKLADYITCQPGAKSPGIGLCRASGHTFRLQRVLGRVRLGNVNDSVDVEGYLLARRAPVLVAEAVDVLAVVLGLKGVVAVRGGLLENFILAVGVGDLLFFWGAALAIEPLHRPPPRVFLR